MLFLDCNGPRTMTKGAINGSGRASSGERKHVVDLYPDGGVDLGGAAGDPGES